MKTYNLLVSYTGYREITFLLPRYGEFRLETGKPVLLLNVPTNVVEALRTLASSGITFVINPKQTSAPRVINYSELKTPLERMVDKQNARLKALGVIKEEKVVEVKEEKVVEEEPVKEVYTKEDYGTYTITAGRYKNKTIAEVDSLGKLDSVFNNSNVEVQEKITSYYKQKVGE